jgi:hypothetical protein
MNAHFEPLSCCQIVPRLKDVGELRKKSGGKTVRIVVRRLGVLLMQQLFSTAAPSVGVIWLIASGMRCDVVYHQLVHCRMPIGLSR